MKRSKKKWLGAFKPSADAPPLVCYTLPRGRPPDLRPAPHTRQWMDETPDQFAYRCLPLAIANAHAWEILNTVPFEATWSGALRGGIEIKSLDGRVPIATSHFGSGILTFHVGALFRTAAQTNLFVTGPMNLPKHGLYALSAVVETDWSPATFTMNWKFTAPGITVRFEQGEPFCALFPVARGALDKIEPRIERMEDAPEVHEEFVVWGEQRDRFLKQLPVKGSEANERGWEKAYFQGRQPDGRRGPQDHQTKLRLKPFSGPKG